MTDETTIDSEAVRTEHEAEVRRWVQWAYLAGVLIAGTLLMLAFIAVLGSTMS